MGTQGSLCGRWSCLCRPWILRFCRWSASCTCRSKKETDTLKLAWANYGPGAIRSMSRFLIQPAEPELIILTVSKSQNRYISFILSVLRVILKRTKFCWALSFVTRVHFRQTLKHMFSTYPMICRNEVNLWGGSPKHISIHLSAPAPAPFKFQNPL